jgi:hypothetical protein
MNIKKILKAINAKFGKGNLVELCIMDDFSGELLGRHNEQLLYFSNECELYDYLGIARKAPKEREIGPDEPTKNGDIVKYDPICGEKDVVIDDVFSGIKVKYLPTYSLGLIAKVIRPVKKDRVPRREWKRRCLACDEYLKTSSDNVYGIVHDAREILKGNQP